MKSLYLSLVCSLLIVSCKSDKNESITSEATKELTTAEKIANAHGFENWKNVTEVKFTFQVERNTVKGAGRSWTWQPKTDRVVMQAGERTFDYLRSKMDSTHILVDRNFINDKYWLFVPFQLVWDASATISEVKKGKEAPISKSQLDMLTITYPSYGGYTPGDAYDIYFDKNYMISEWTFRKGNSEMPTLSTTFENYKDYKGIKIATDHKQDGGMWNLNFANVIVSKK
jgi:hypothetical protein